MTHHHVLAVQDWGGTQEYWRPWDDPLTRDQAEALARDIVRADALYTSGDPDYRIIGEVEFGERFCELISSNVAPGWEAIWIEPCQEPCTWTADHQPVTAPWWTPPLASRPQRHLRAVR